MKKILKIAKKVLRWTFSIGLILIVLLFFLMEGFDRYLSTERGAHWIFANVPIQQKEVKVTPGGVRYYSIGDTDKPALLLIHGAPGSLFDWKSFAERPQLYERYRLLIVERPGYGATQPAGAEPSIKVQAQHILEVLAPEQQPAVVMGHSYGAPIAVVMAALDTTKVDKVIGVSGQYDPNNEIIFQISYGIRLPIFRYLLPRLVWVSNEEKLHHPEALREIMPVYEEIQRPVILIHGDADTLVPYENSPFLLDYLGNSGQLITLKGYDHPLQMSAVDFLVDFVLDKAVAIPEK